MDRTPSPFYLDEEALRGLIVLCGQDLYGRSLLRTGNERIARALSRRVLLRLAELDKDTPVRYCRLLADAYLEQTLSEWELAMLQNSVRAGGSVPEALPAPGYGTEPAPRARNRVLNDPSRHGESPGIREDAAPEPALADETPYPRSRRKPRRTPPAPVPDPPEEEMEEEDAFSGSGRAPAWLIAILAALCLVLLWFALGLFMRMGALPFIDLGYRFFNARLLPLF